MRKRALATAILALLTLLGVLLWRSRAPEQALLVLEPKNLYAPRELALPPASTLTRQSQATVPEPVVSTSVEPTNTAATPAAIDINGRVLEDGTLVPLEGYSVSFMSQGDPNRDKLPTVKAITDSRGSFHASLGANEWSLNEVCSIEIADRAGVGVYFGDVALERELTFLVEPVVPIHGQLIMNRAIDFTQVVVVISAAPDFDNGVYLYCARTKLEADGQFHASFAPRQRFDRYFLTFANLAGTFTNAMTTRAALTSQAGAIVRCSLGGVRLTVVDEKARAIEGVEVRAGTENLTRSGAWSTSKSDARGRVDFLFEEGEVEICAGKQGFVPEHFAFAVSAQDDPLERTVVLQTLGAQDEISGTVLSPKDEPVQNAVITAHPRVIARDIGVAGFVQTKTDASGHFRLPVRMGSEIVVYAYHRDYGMAPEYPMIAQRTPLVLRFEGLGKIELHLHGTFPGTLAFAEPIEYGLIDEHLDRNIVGSEHASPIVIEEVPAGEYLAVVRLKGISGYGSAKVRIEAGATQRVDISLAHSSTFAGLVVRSSGIPAQDIAATLHHPLWKNELETWGRSRTDTDGRFSIFGGDLAQGELSFVEGTHEVAHVHALDNAPVLVRIGG